MWKAYSLGYLKHNKSGNRFVFIISFLASMLLGTVSGMFYNFWMDQVQQSLAKTGTSHVEATPAIIAYIVVFTAASIALILMIHHAFEATMTSRVHQLGILQSVGATPRQIRTALTNEVLAVSLPAIIAGNIVGIFICWGFMQFIINSTADLRDYALTFVYSPVVFLGSVFFSLFTAAVSAWIPARKLGRMTALEAIRSGDETPIRRVRKYRLMSAILGVHGELACKSMYARRKAMRVGTLSLFFAVLAFISLLNMFGISNLSTQKTYFERYKDKWDFLVTAASPDDCIDLLNEIRSIDGVDTCSTHRILNSSTMLPQEHLSDEVKAVGLQNISGITADESGAYKISVPIYILDDHSFTEYSGDASENAVVAVNIIWDSVNSERTARSYIPFLNEGTAISLTVSDTPIEVTCFTGELPSLREELKHYALSLVVSESTYASLLPDTTVEGLTFTAKAADESAHERILTELNELVSGYPSCTVEGRLEEAEDEAQMQQGLRMLIYLFAGLMASIGIANVFASTLGQLHQRKREFARYFSIGMTPNGAARILAAEAAIVALRPILLTILLNIPLMVLMLDAGGISAKEFVTERMPLVPAIVFFAAIIGFVALAYWLGARKICSMELTETLKDDTMAM